ncbi:hypothetical protein VaNZ11_014054 [Volvox africanus]|uniref:PPM-type phosphatase domain-containing protein n=1 Tax=Volvox africanus TaxID=51714 RepID=A0ABQ5SJA5_9CHLO|nr:hypothetical protein VaNZ11_014054 [Volvox africanus]
MSLSVSSLAASDSGAASVDTQSFPPVAGRDREQEPGGPRSGGSSAGLGLSRVRSHALFLNDEEVEEAGKERVIVPKQINLAAGSPDLQYDMGRCAVQGVSSKMEDRVLVYDLSHHPHFSGCRRAVLMAVLDGHAGSGAVSYLEEHLAQHVLEEVASQIGCPPVLEIPQPAQHQHHQHHVRQNLPNQHRHHSHQHQQRNSQHSQPNLQPYQPPHLRHQQQQQQAATSEAPAPRHSQQQDLAKQQLELEQQQQPAVAPQPVAVLGQQILPQEHEKRPEVIFSCTTSSTLTIVSGSFRTDSRPIAAAAAPASPTMAAAAAASAAATAAAVAAAAAVAVASPLTELSEGSGDVKEVELDLGAVPGSQLTGEAATLAPRPAVEVSVGSAVTPEGARRNSSGLSLELRTPGPIGAFDWDPADVASSNGYDDWAADDDGEEFEEDEEEAYADGPWAPPLNHSAAAERRQTSLAAYDSGCGCQPPDPPAALRNALLRCERELMDQDCHSGTTALVALMLGGSLWLANVGDCRAVVCDDGEARQLTVDHKAGTGRPDAGAAVCGAALLERQRLLALGVQLSSDGYLQVTAPDGSCADIAVSRNLGCAHLKDRSCSGRGSNWAQNLYTSQNQGQHMHMQRHSSRGARLSACSGSSGMRISTSGAAAPAGAPAAAGRGGSAGSVEWPQQQHRQQQKSRHHHASAPGSVSGGLDDLAGFRSAVQPQGAHPPDPYHHHHQTRNHHTHHGHIQHPQQPPYGEKSPSAEGYGGTQGQVTHHHNQRHQRHSRQSGNGSGFESRSDPSILTFSHPSNQPRQQQHQQQLPLQPNLHLTGSMNSGLRHHHRDEHGLSHGDFDGLKGSCSNHQNVQGALVSSQSVASYDDGCSVAVTDGSSVGNGSGQTQVATTTLTPANTSLAGIAFRQSPSPIPPSLAPLHDQQPKVQQHHQELSPRPPRPPSSGSISASNQVGGGSDLYIVSPRLQSSSPMPIRSAMTTVSVIGSCSPDQQQPPAADAAAPGTAATTRGRVPMLQPFGDSGSQPGSVSRPGSRPGSGTGFTIVQPSGGSGYNLGLPPRPPSLPGGGGTAVGGAAVGGRTAVGVQQYSQRRSSSGGGGGGSCRTRELRSLSPALPFGPVLVSGGGYCRLSPLEEGGSSSSGVEGSSPGGMGCCEVVSSLMGPGCSVAAAAAPIRGGVAGGCREPVMEPPEAGAAATAGANPVALAVECTPAQDDGKRGSGAADTALKTAVTFSTWTLNSTYMDSMPEELAAVMSAAAVDGVVLTPPLPPTPPEVSSPANSMTAADGSIGAGRRSSGLFGSGAALSESSAGVCSSAAGVLIPDPDLFYYEISEDSEFLICACDGLWDVMQNVDACRFVRRWLADGGTAAGAAKMLCDIALKWESHDNISVVILRFSARPLARAASSSRLHRAEPATDVAGLETDGQGCRWRG